MGGITLLSRIFGFARDLVIAWLFGAGMSADAFFVAFRIPNLLRRLFAEGSLTVAFVPVFTDYLTRKGRGAAFELARAAFFMLAIILAIVAVAGVLFSPVIVGITAPGFLKDPEKFALTVMLTRVMFPYIFLIGLVALGMGVLNSLGHFAAPAAAPVCLNLAIIFSALFISPHLKRPVEGLALGVLIGGCAQLALQIPFLLKKGLVIFQKTSLAHPGLKKIGTLMLPTIFGAAVYQVNILVGTLLASLLPPGSVSYLYYADRLVQFPLGIFAIAAATAVLPGLSRLASKSDIKGLSETFGEAMNFVLFVTIPAAVGLIVLREPIIALLFKRGAFDEETVRLTAVALLYYGAGLWAFSSVRIVVSIYYALKDTKTPVKAAVVSLVANIFLGILLMRWLAHGGLALATSVASVINLVFLLVNLKRRFMGFRLAISLSQVLRMLICSFCMGAAVWGLSLVTIPAIGGGTRALGTGLLLTVIFGVAVYFFLAFLLRVSALGMLLPSFRRSAVKE